MPSMSSMTSVTYFKPSNILTSVGSCVHILELNSGESAQNSKKLKLLYWKCWLGCPNFASKKVLLQSETKRNANGFAWFRFLFAKLWKKNFASFRFVSLQKFRFVSLKNMFRFKVSLWEQFRFVSLKNILPSPPQHLSSYAACRNFL